SALLACGARTGIDKEGPQLPDVTGTWVDRYVTEAGVTESPADLSDARIQAIFQDGGGGWQPGFGTGGSDGTFVIAGVPLTEFFLSIDRGTGLYDYYFSAERHINLGADYGGRRDQTLLMHPPSYVATLDGLAPSSEGDRLGLVSFDANGRST